MTYPRGWNADYDLTPAVGEVLAAAECGWLQMTVQLGFVMAQVLTWEEDAGLRVAMAETLTAKLMEAARLGRIPEDTVQ